MTQSIARRLVVPASLAATYSTIPGPSGVLQWPIAASGMTLDYSVDVSALLADVSDTLATVKVSASPSGSGELSLIALQAVGGVITVWASNGVAGRAYRVRFICITAAGRTFEVYAYLKLDFNEAVFPLITPPSSGYGAPIMWTAGWVLSLRFNRPLSSSLAAAA